LKPLRLQLTFITLTRIVQNTAYRMVYPFLPVFGRGLGVDLALLSGAVAARSLLGAAGPFLASLADSRGRKLGMLVGQSIFALGASLVLFWPVYPVFVLALMLTLAGKYVFDPSVLAYIGDRIPYERRGALMAITEFGWSLSFILGIPLMGILIARYGWQGPFPVLTLLGVVTLAGLAWVLPRDPGSVEGQPGMWRNLHAVLTSLPALTGLGMGFLMSAANEIVNLVFGVWMEDSFGLKIAALGAASAVIGLSELGGEGLTATLVDRLGKPRAVALGLAVNCLAALALPLVGRSLPGALAGLFFFYISFEFTIVSSIPMMSEIVPSARATMMSTSGAAFSLGRALGALLATPLYLLGFWGSCLAAVAFNLMALVALNHLRKRLEKRGLSANFANGR
jgi:predicted MFS family arabinose efflux permease